MKAISLWQPWASLWCSGVKIHETRHWPTNHRGWLLVHAAKRSIDDFVGSGDRLDEICDGTFGHHWGIDLPRGAIVGMVNVIACRKTEDILQGYYDADDYECGDFSHGRYGWQADNFKAFTKPIPYRGQQGMFTVPDSLVPIDIAA